MAETQVIHDINTPVTPDGVDDNGHGQCTDTFLPDFDVDHQGQGLSNQSQGRHTTLALIRRMGRRQDEVGDDWLAEDRERELSDDGEEYDKVSEDGSDQEDDGSDKESPWNDHNLEEVLEGELTEETVPCQACLEEVANQQGHMYPGGCLYLE